MTINFYDGNITPDQEVLDDTQLFKSVSMLEPGNIGYINSEAYWPDAEGRVWVDSNAPVHYSDDVLPEEFEGDPEYYVRLICTEVGMIIDDSQLSERFDSAPSEDRRLTRIPSRRGVNDLVEVVGLARSEGELSELEAILERQFDIELGKSVIKLINNSHLSGEEDTQS